MKLQDKPLTALTAADLMSREVITVPTGMSLRGAALLLTRAHVSGAPVVDERGRCVGVLSTSDFLKLAGGAAPHGRSTSCVCSEWQVMELEHVPEDDVQHYMTPDPVTVSSSAPSLCWAPLWSASGCSCFSRSAFRPSRWRRR